MFVNQKQLSQYLGISTRRIRQLREDGVFKKKTDSAAGYSLEECIQEYIEYKVNAETGRRTSISKEEVQAEHEEVKKQISLLKLRRLKRELHEATDVEFFLNDMLVRFRKYLMALPPRLAMNVTGVEDMAVVTETIRNEMRKALEELGEYDPDEIDGIESLLEEEPDEEEEDIE